MVGFSLFEILITLLLVGIVAAITIPSQQYFFQSFKVQIAAEQLLHATQVARNEAVLRNKVVSLSKIGEWREGYVIKDDNRVLYSFRNSVSKGVIYWRAFPSSENDLKFLPNGFLAAQNGTFWFCYPGHAIPEWAIVLNQGGRARMVGPEKNGKIREGVASMRC